ncbi:MAG: phospholipase A [Sulfuricurvum sp.]
MKRVVFWVLPLLLLASTLFASDAKLLKEASKLEDEARYEEAMQIYKEIALKHASKDIQLPKSSTSGFYEHLDRLEDEQTQDSLKQIVTKDFGIFAYKKNYFLPLTYTFEDLHDRKSTETAFQISLEKPLFENLLGLDETISLGYTQRSFWQTTKKSAPFRETNYSPEIFLVAPISGVKNLKGVKFSALHYSNGRDGKQSRSTNRAYAELFFQYKDLFISPKIWYKLPFGTQDRDAKELYNYYGYGELSMLYTYKKQTFDLLFRNNLKHRTNRSSLELNWTFELPESFFTHGIYGIVQFYHGYGHSLIDFDKKLTNVGFGFAISR